jgi:hypothetical protein
MSLSISLSSIASSSSSSSSSSSVVVVDSDALLKYSQQLQPVDWRVVAHAVHRSSYDCRRRFVVMLLAVGKVGVDGRGVGLCV